MAAQNLSEVLAPVFKVDANDADALRRAVTEVAETLAFLGVLFVTKEHKVISGLTDEQAVIKTIQRYSKDHSAHIGADRFIRLQNLVSAITRLPRPVPPALAGRRS